MSVRRYSPSPAALEIAARVLKTQGLDFSQSARLAAAVQKLSDYFISEPDGATPWGEDWAVTAYFAYYLVLNEIRNRAVVDQGVAAGFFRGLTRAIDFGAGPGTATLALRPHLQQFSLIERSSVPAKLLAGEGLEYSPGFKPAMLERPAETLFAASYSLTETALPDEALKCEALMIVEPATHQDGRRLLDLRARLLDEGYSMWAPCTHQMECPLRKHSPRDWCHDRVGVDAAPWMTALEEHLPFRNQTITMSYLLARRSRPPATSLARLTGDRLEENGKDRQLFCRSDEREFLSWLHRHGEAPDLPRGIRVELPPEAKKAGNELRLTPDWPKVHP